MEDTLEKIDKKIENLRTSYRLQRENANFYWNNRNDPFYGAFWDDQANQTKKEIVQLEEEKAVIKKWSEK